MGRISKVFENQKENLLFVLGCIVTILIIVCCAIAIAPWIISTVGMPMLQIGVILIPAICVGIVIGLIYKAYCAIRKKK